MQTVATWFESATAPGDAGWRAEMRRLLWRLLGALDGLIPPREFSQDAELPPEWFKYPPI